MSDEVLCSFCSRSRREVGHMVKGARAYICDGCTERANGVIAKQKEAGATESSKELPTPDQIKAHLDRYVIGQDEAKRILSVAVYHHYLRLFDIRRGIEDDTEIEKSNVLLLGPTGCGKTLLAKSIARLLDVPFCIADATTLTEAGYVGDDVEDIISRLLANAGGNVAKAQRGIVYIDEIDKIARRGASAMMSRDVRGEGVQQALLKLLEGTTCMVGPNGQRRHGSSELTAVDTTNILFICGGSFAGIEPMIEGRINVGGVGFGSKHIRKDITLTELMDNVSVDDLRNFGMIPEFLGRLPIITALRELNVEQLVEVLTQPRNAIMKQKERTFSFMGVKLTFTQGALEAVAEQAIRERRGARGLRSIVERVLMELQYELPSKRGVYKEVVIEADTVKGSAKPTLVEADPPSIEPAPAEPVNTDASTGKSANS